MTGPADLSLVELAAAIARREYSPLDAVRAALERIDATDPALNCFVALRAEEALAEAEEAGRELVAGRARGLLHGVPVAVKDNLAVAGTITAAGAAVLAENRTDHDAEAVRRLRAAGAIVVGKTNLHELAYGSTTINPHFGPTRNPHDHDRIAGGSSGGSAAAVAAGQVPLALGTDHAGSVRIPAALCGVVGLKPTHGRVSLRGLVAGRNASADHVGPLTRTVADAALALDVLAGHDPRDPGSLDRPVPVHRHALREDLRGLRVGVPASWCFTRVDPEVESVVRAAIDRLAELGASVREVEIPDLEDLVAGRNALAAEGLPMLEPHLRAHPERIGEDVRRTALALYFVPARDLARARRARRLLAERFAAVFATVDLLALPSTPVVAFPISARTVTLPDGAGGQAEVPAGRSLIPLTSPANLAGVPAISVPAGLTSAGLPVGLQLQARPFAEEVLLGAAHAYERATS